MFQGETVFQLLYVSHLVAGADFAVVKEIVTAARQRNPTHGITGALLFDGERFCQLIEGGEAEIGALMRSIQSDPRHTDVQIILAGQAASGRASRGWVSGYCDVNELEVFTMTAGPRDAQALQVFLSVLGGADVE